LVDSEGVRTGRVSTDRCRKSFTNLTRFGEVALPSGEERRSYGVNGSTNESPESLLKKSRGKKNPCSWSGSKKQALEIGGGPVERKFGEKIHIECINK